LRPLSAPIDRNLLTNPRIAGNIHRHISQDSLVTRKEKEKKKKKKKEERRRKTERKKPDTRKPENILDVLKNRTRLTQVHQSH